MAARILIVDDDPDIVESFKVTLESAGYAVSSAASGDSGLALAQKEKPDLILLDVMMATLSEGFHVAYELKQDPVLKEIPIIMITGVGKEAGVNFAQEAGSDYIKAEAFLEKPVAPKALLAEVAKWLKGKK